MNPNGLCLRTTDGAVLGVDTERWLGDPPPEEEHVLDLAQGPVLDVGCGPGRHVLALARRGVVALGVDVTPAVVALARERGAAVLERSIFGHLPGRGRWGAALLLDGNLGIGGDVAALLSRLAGLLRPGGRVLAELERPSAPPAAMRVRLEHEGHAGPWFGWVRVGMDDLGDLAAGAGFEVVNTWTAGGRWFARLDRP